MLIAQLLLTTVALGSILTFVVVDKNSWVCRVWENDPDAAVVLGETAEQEKEPCQWRPKVRPPT